MRIVRFNFGGNIFYGELNSETITQWSDAPWLGGTKQTVEFNLTSVKLLAPCTPRKIIATAINYEGSTGLPEGAKEPLVFLKPSTSVIGPGDTIVSPFNDVPVWGESELAIVIGKKLCKASKEEAIGGIFGFTIGNDVSAENLYGWDHHLARSKAADTFCALGPWIDTDYKPESKKIRGFHNGVLLREGDPTQRLIAEPELLVWLSKWMTLEPGDVILTGAPNRVRDREYLKTGDTFTCAIEGLGELTNDFLLYQNS
jgi:2-keto-4-pentenoate hydratase/2-oxohepta-3-ene-1,7-dioic acid hydratase in catechol pathway